MLIAGDTKTVAYERAGIGASDPSSERRTVKQFAIELRALLAVLKVPPPYVLVGHSYGGPIIHTYAAMFPKEVAGLVYVDPTDFMQTLADMQAVWASAGVKNGHDAEAEMFKQMLAGAPTGIVAEHREFERVERAGFVEFREAGDPPDVPLSALIASQTETLPPSVVFPGNFEKYFKTMIDQRIDHFARLTRRSTNGHLVLTSKSSHFIHGSEPDLVAAEVRSVLAVAAPHPELERFVGTYPLTPAFAITVTRDGDRVFLQATGQPKFQIFADSPTVFSLRIVDAKLEFEVDSAGRVTGLVLVQNGLRQRAAKK